MVISIERRFGFRNCYVIYWENVAEKTVPIGEYQRLLYDYFPRFLHSLVDF